eukprot:s5492_g6.t1
MTLATWQSRTQQLGAMADHEVLQVEGRQKALADVAATFLDDRYSVPAFLSTVPHGAPQRNPVGPGESAAGEDPPRTGRASLSAWIRSVFGGSMRQLQQDQIRASG